jgi:very-short-patch-repair endonuclease
MMAGIIGHARRMRRVPTRSEDRLWSWLRDRRFDGYKFRRQVPFAGYILDFYCPQLKLALEVDGRHHQTAWMSEYDSARSIVLNEHGIHLVRIPNELLIRDSRLAAQCIEAAVLRAAESKK